MIAGLGLAALGLIGGLPVIATSNAWDIPRWIPLFVALACASTAAYTWAPLWPLRVLAAYWSLVAASWARPGLLHIGIDVWAWLALPPVAVALGLLAWGDRGPTSRACALSAFVLPVVALDLLIPAAAALDAATYGFTLAAAGTTALAAQLHRRDSCPNH